MGKKAEEAAKAKARPRRSDAENRKPKPLVQAGSLVMGTKSEESAKVEVKLRRCVAENWRLTRDAADATTPEAEALPAEERRMKMDAETRPKATAEATPEAFARAEASANKAGAVVMGTVSEEAAKVEDKTRRSIAENKELTRSVANSTTREAEAVPTEEHRKKVEEETRPKAKAEAEPEATAKAEGSANTAAMTKAQKTKLETNAEAERIWKQQEDARVAAARLAAAKEEADAEEETRQAALREEKARKAAAARWSRFQGHTPLGGSDATTSSVVGHLPELRAMFPDASEALLEGASQVASLDEAMDMLMFNS